MELIKVKEIKKVTEARKIIDNLQVRLLAREQALDDLARAAEIAEFSKQYHLVTSFRQTAEEQLVDRIVIPTVAEDQDIKIRIYE